MKVILTRPLVHMDTAINAYAQAGFDCLAAPCIDIKPEPSLKPLWLDFAKKADCLVVLSAHAIEGILKVQPEFRVKQPERVLAVGPAVQATWKQHFNQAIDNAGGDSEAVIRHMKTRQVKGVCVLTAAGGRELIKAYALKNRINYTQINCYQRHTLPLDVDEWQITINQGSMILTATSGQILEHIQQSLSDQLWAQLLQQPFVVPSKRLTQKAQGMGFTDIILAKGASNEAMIEAIKENQLGKRVPI